MINEPMKFETQGPFLFRYGRSRAHSQNYSNKKLCFVSNDRLFLEDLLFELSNNDECYFVKLTNHPREGMYLGRCFFTNDTTVGLMWARYKLHPKVVCNVQDDDFCKDFREHVISYRDKSPNTK